MWIKNFINELRAWFIVKKVYDDNRSDFLSLNIKSSWFGKLYTVINRSVDIDLGSEEDNVYLQNDLAKIWQLFVKHNIADIVAYELKPLDGEHKIDETHVEYEHGYLLTFTPAWNLDRQYVTFWSVLGVLTALTGIVTGITYLVKFLVA